ncbi:dipeptidase [Hespellia stercorisuis]|uniref:Membrane dipeptidase n=1 Tax=Hespellia stercorisuis DSM 15480 TaxID=1121950 RepID=A0A1M6TVR4_9FIRM|nr:dipeptidase [Hespellia stercorisuis]SHK61031.1 membrane dipeptidase [Hespellia stercorisuis DSM 15480]
MSYIDMHCDTLMEAYFAKQTNMYELPTAMVDVARLQKGGCMAQFFAIFLPCEDIWDWYKAPKVDDDAYIRSCASIFRETITANPAAIAFAKNDSDIEENSRQSKISVFLTVEDGRDVRGDLNRLKSYYDMGVRLLSLTWNEKNCFGSPNSRDAKVMNQGLTEFGRDAVEYMNELGMLVDVSHLSDGGFYDVAQISKKPFVASHSNSREVCGHPRNLTDDMIRTLAQKGGVAGLNFGPEFLDDTSGNEASTIKKMVEHISHMINIGGIESVAIGTDFDGIEGSLEIGSADKMPMLFAELKRQGIPESGIDKIAYQNVRRVISEVLI